VPPTRPPYPPEFKEEAIRLMRSSVKPLAQISRELDVSEQTLRNWRKQEERDEGEREGLTTEEKEELGRLRRENKVLRQEVEILRKATVGSTGQCNTLGFRCCLDRRCASGEAGSSRRAVGGGQEGAVGAVEGWRVNKLHRPGTTEGSRLHSQNDRGHRGLHSVRAAQARMRAHSGRAGGDLPRARYGRISACDRRPAQPVGFHHLGSN
jgi:transposase